MKLIIFLSLWFLLVTPEETAPEHLMCELDIFEPEPSVKPIDDLVYESKPIRTKRFTISFKMNCLALSSGGTYQEFFQLEANDQLAFKVSVNF